MTSYRAHQTSESQKLRCAELPSEHVLSIRQKKLFAKWWKLPLSGITWRSRPCCLWKGWRLCVWQTERNFLEAGWLCSSHPGSKCYWWRKPENHTNGGSEASTGERRGPPESSPVAFPALHWSLSSLFSSAPRTASLGWPLTTCLKQPPLLTVLGAPFRSTYHNQKLLC